jgi:hypothetical protein
MLPGGAEARIWCTHGRKVKRDPEEKNREGNERPNAARSYTTIRKRERKYAGRAQSGGYHPA